MGAVSYDLVEALFGDDGEVREVRTYRDDFRLSVCILNGKMIAWEVSYATDAEAANEISQGMEQIKHLMFQADEHEGRVIVWFKHDPMVYLRNVQMGVHEQVRGCRSAA